MGKRASLIKCCLCGFPRWMAHAARRTPRNRTSAQPFERRWTGKHHLMSLPDCRFAGGAAMCCVGRDNAAALPTVVQRRLRLPGQDMDACSIAGLPLHFCGHRGGRWCSVSERARARSTSLVRSMQTAGEAKWGRVGDNISQQAQRNRSGRHDWRPSDRQQCCACSRARSLNT